MVSSGFTHATLFAHDAPLAFTFFGTFSAFCSEFTPVFEPQPFATFQPAISRLQSHTDKHCTHFPALGTTFLTKTFRKQLFAS